MDDEDSYDDDETAGARSGSSQGDKEKVNQSAVRAIRRVMGPHVAERRVATNGHHHQPNGSGTHTDEREAVQPGETMLCYPGAAFGVTTVSQWDAAPPHNSSSRAQSSERGRRGSRRRAAKLQRVIVTAADSPVALSLDNAADAWLRPDLPEKLKVASGDLRVAEIQVRLFLALADSAPGCSDHGRLRSLHSSMSSIVPPGWTATSTTWTDPSRSSSATRLPRTSCATLAPQSDRSGRKTCVSGGLGVLAHC